MTAEDAPQHVLVIGATGSIGRLVVEQLLEHGDTTRALSRDPEKAARLLVGDVEIVTGDINNPAAMRAAVLGIDAVVLTHGAPYGSGDYQAIDYGAVPALLEALNGRTVRVALMSSIGVTHSGGSARELLRWKQRGERLLRASGLPYTIVRPGWFDAGNASDQRVELKQGDQVKYGPVHRRHVAQTLVAAIHAPSARGKTLEVFTSHGDPIEDWVAAFDALEPDQPGGLDGARDDAGPAVADEPRLVRADLNRLSRTTGPTSQQGEVI